MRLPPVYVKPIPCKVPKVAEPAYEPTVCGSLLCSTVQQVVDHAVWLNKEANYRKAVAKCPYVVPE